VLLGTGTVGCVACSPTHEVLATACAAVALWVNDADDDDGGDGGGDADGGEKAESMAD
jgi:hypothetical protein